MKKIANILLWLGLMIGGHYLLVDDTPTQRKFKYQEIEYQLSKHFAEDGRIGRHSFKNFETYRHNDYWLDVSVRYDDRFLSYQRLFTGERSKEDRYFLMSLGGIDDSQIETITLPKNQNGYPFFAHYVVEYNAHYSFFEETMKVLVKTPNKFILIGLSKKLDDKSDANKEQMIKYLSPLVETLKVTP